MSADRSSMTCKIIPFPSTDRRLDLDRITELAQETEELLAISQHDLHLAALLDLLDDAKQTLAELGCILLTDSDLARMKTTLNALNTLIAKTRDHLQRLEQTSPS